MSRYNTTADDREELKDVFGHNQSAQFLEIHFLLRLSVIDLLKDFDDLQLEVKRLKKDVDRAYSIAQGSSDRCDVHLADVEQLKSIVDKLPKTGDGVSVVPGMGLWRKHGEYMREEDHFWSGYAHYHYWYSTREAAEAAGKEVEV